MRKETKATMIPESVKLAVLLRDKGECVICSCPGFPNAHIVRRSQGGRGIEQNIVTLCAKCHREMDEGKQAQIYKSMVIKYIRGVYPGWTEESVKYHKEDNI